MNEQVGLAACVVKGPVLSSQGFQVHNMQPVKANRGTSKSCYRLYVFSLDENCVMVSLVGVFSQFC